MKIALLGSAITTRDQAPYDDRSWEIWSSVSMLPYARRMDRLFELHHLDDVRRATHGRLDMVYARPRAVGCREVLVHESIPDSFGVVRTVFPYEEVLRYLGRRYVTSSISWMLAYALMKGRASEVGVWGAEMTIASGAFRSDYGWERANFEWLLGRAEQSGIKVTLPDGCPLLRTTWLYGLESGANAKMSEALETRASKAERETAEHKAEAARLASIINQIQARIDERDQADIVPTSAGLERVALLRSELALLEDAHRAEVAVILQLEAVGEELQIQRATCTIIDPAPEGRPEVVVEPPPVNA